MCTYKGVTRDIKGVTSMGYTTEAIDGIRNRENGCYAKGQTFYRPYSKKNSAAKVNSIMVKTARTQPKVNVSSLLNGVPSYMAGVSLIEKLNTNA